MNNHGLRVMGSDELFDLWWTSRDGGARTSNSKLTAQKLFELKWSIAEAQSRTSAFASIIAEKLQAGEDTEDLERRMLDELDKLLELRLDYGALSFLSGTYDDPVK